MISHEMQQNRFELKYIVSERCASALRDFARSYLVPDEHADPVHYSYAIHSLYLDGPGLPLYKATAHGHKNRFKLRIRYYDDNPESPVFFEIKRRVNDVILKQRAMVRRSCVPRLLAGDWPDYSDLCRENDRRGMEGLERFCELQYSNRAVGRTIVSYVREAWVTPEDNSVRMTFDRNLISTAWEGDLLAADFAGGLRPPMFGAVLELKFTNRFPHWMRDMVRSFNLERVSVSKYVNCIEAMHARERTMESQRVMGALLAC